MLSAVVDYLKVENSAPIMVSTSLHSKGCIRFHSIPLSYLPKGISQVDLSSLFSPGKMLRVKKL